VSSVSSPTRTRGRPASEPVLGECVACGIRVKYIAASKTWCHDARLLDLFAAAASLDLDPLHRIYVLVDP
jgi:hypothetical protein